MKMSLAQNLTTRRSLSRAGVIALAATCAALGAQASSAHETDVPPVPTNIAVPAGNKVFLVGHATGTQNYICLPSGTGFKFVLFTPEATLFDDAGKQVTTHFFSPNPVEGGTIRATWEHSRGASTVWGS